MNAEQSNSPAASNERPAPSFLSIKKTDGTTVSLFFNKFVKGNYEDDSAWFSAKSKDTGVSHQAYLGSALRWGEKADGQSKVQSWSTAYGFIDNDGKLAWGKGGVAMVEVRMQGPQGRALFDFALERVKQSRKEFFAQHKTHVELPVDNDPSNVSTNSSAVLIGRQPIAVELSVADDRASKMRSKRNAK